MLPQLRIEKEARMIYDADDSNYNVYIKNILIQLHLIPLMVNTVLNMINISSLTVII